MDLGDLLDCLSCGKMIDRKLVERMRGLGIGLDARCRCVKRSETFGREDGDLDLQFRNEFSLLAKTTRLAT